MRLIKTRFEAVRCCEPTSSCRVGIRCKALGGSDSKDTRRSCVRGGDDVEGLVGMIRSGLLVLGMVLHAGGLLLLALNGREGMGLTLYSASIFLLAISALLRRKGWSPGS